MPNLLVSDVLLLIFLFLKFYFKILLYLFPFSFPVSLGSGHIVFDIVDCVFQIRLALFLSNFDIFFCLLLSSRECFLCGKFSSLNSLFILLPNSLDSFFSLLSKSILLLSMLACLSISIGCDPLNFVFEAFPNPFELFFVLDLNCFYSIITLLSLSLQRNLKFILDKIFLHFFELMLKIMSHQINLLSMSLLQ